MKKYLVAALLSTMLATPALAASVVNGSFETPAVTGSPAYNPPFEPNGGAFGYANAVDGRQILHLQGTASYSLGLTDLVLGGKYAISFYAAARPGYLNLPVNVFYNNTLIGSLTPTSTAFTLQTGYVFNAVGTMGTVSFVGTNLTPSTANDQNAGFDVVSIAAVPEPATWAMMLLGFGMVGFGLRSRRNGKVATRVAFG